LRTPLLFGYDPFLEAGEGKFIPPAQGGRKYGEIKGMLRRGRSSHPYRDAELRRMVLEILEELPDDLAAAVENVMIVIEDRPAQALLDEYPDLDRDILGLYIGVPLSQQSTFGGFSLPAQIYLFRDNIARYARHPIRLRRELRETLLHEIGHHLGLDEEDLERLERG